MRSTRFWAPALLVFLYVGTEQSIWDWQVTYFTTESPGVDPVTAARLREGSKGPAAAVR